MLKKQNKEKIPNPTSIVMFYVFIFVRLIESVITIRACLTLAIRE